MNASLALEQTASAHAGKTAYTFLNTSATYGELNETVTRFAAGLQSLGLQKGDHIALLLGNSPHFIIALYGAMRAGVTVIPVNPVYTLNEISYILQNGDVKAVVMLDLLLPATENMHESLPSVEHYIVCESGDERAAGTTASSFTIYSKLKAFSELIANRDILQCPDIHEEDTAVILYTSGTTGQPKGAMLTHKNIYSNARDVADYLSITEKDTVITVLPMFHVFCLTVVLNAPIVSGAEMIILPAFSPKEVFKAAIEKKATIFAGVPTMYNFLFQFPDSNPADFSSIRLCISGGASMPVSLLEQFEKKFNVQISEGYGLSEASPVTAFNPLDRPRKAGSIGCSISNVENKIVNELGEEVIPGQVGELIVRGPNVMKGYYKMPEETGAAIRDGWLYTGDLARQDDEGYLYIVDRKKDLVIVGGYNVYPREVEEVLYEHDDIVEAAVLGAPDPDYGEAVLAFVVQKGNSLTEEEVLNYCRERLVSYKVPRSVEFLLELPKNTTGKILRRSLKDQIVKK
ncbi:fatty acid--CoA ligase family protein [Domibacillus iocasae]|uniref:Long-chain fatty acid--CoA ligase n=1 Tax=Domibacillus iocasae TaxID=1714016 RepID=A0A1E7DLJ8_9BACI|nr:fatty acid--CoA ligase family protein [Domibacillus iocasae]OES43951.1 long-chain fatty acid--CoA ligase [Domibacillus iocasae]